VTRRNEGQKKITCEAGKEFCIARYRRQGFPRVQIDMFPRLERFDVEFDLPNAFGRVSPSIFCSTFWSSAMFRVPTLSPSTAITVYSKIF